MDKNQQEENHYKEILKNNSHGNDEEVIKIMNSGDKKLMKSLVILCVKQSLDFHHEDIIEKIFDIYYEEHHKDNPFLILTNTIIEFHNRFQSV